jgi:membrane protease YdiL (CAAX protease family)
MKTRIIQDEPPQRRPGSTGPFSADGAAIGSAGGQVNSGRGSTPIRSGLPGLVQRHPLASFVVLAYAFAWCLLPLGGFLPFGPLLAALIVLPITQGVAGLRELGSRMIRWRVSWVWYLAAISLPLLVHLITTLLNQAIGGSKPELSQFTPGYAVLLVFAVHLLNPTMGPMGEEPGWRGVAQPMLQSRHSPLRSAGILALIVTGWHLPLAFIPQFDLGPADIGTTAAVTFWYAWLFNRSGGSVLLTMIAHATEGTVDLGQLWPAAADSARQSWLWLVVWSALVVSLLLFDRRAWRLPATVAEPAPRSDRPEPVPEPGA